MPDSLLKKTEKGFKRWVESCLSLLFNAGDPTRIPVAPEKVRSILVLRPDKLGDMIATIPVIHALKKEYPHLRIEVLASPRNRMLVDHDLNLNAVHIYTKNIFKDLPMILRLRRQRFDIIYDPICHDSVTGLILSKWIGKGAIKAAARKLKMSRFYDYCVPYEPDGHDHSFDNSMLIFNVLGRNSAEVDPFYPPVFPESARKTASDILSTLRQANKTLIGINISAGSPSRALSIEKYLEIALGIHSCHPDSSFFVSCTMDDRNRGEQLVASLAGKATLVPEGLSFHSACAIIGGLDILISPDTSLVHVARLMKVPVLGLYSGHLRNFYFWKPYRQDVGWVISDHFDHLLDINPQDVIDEFDRLLKSLKVAEGEPQ